MTMHRPRFATWNVLAQPFIEPRWYPNHDSSLWDYETRLERIINCIKNACGLLDVLFLQEVTIEMYDELKTALANHYTFGKLALHDQRTWSEYAKSRPYGNVTLVATWFGEFLSQTANYWHSSGTVYDTSVIVSFCRRDVYVTVNVHLDSESAQLRLEETDELLEHTLGVNHLVVAGDLNSNEPELHSRFAKFGLESAVPHDKPQYTFLDSDAMIDYLYFRGIPVLDAKVIAPKSAFLDGSDHHVVVAELGFPF